MRNPLGNTALMAAALVLLAQTAAADSKMTIRTTMMGSSNEGTTYVKGARERTEMNAMGSSNVSIIQCDQKRLIIINPQANTCMVTPMSGVETPVVEQPAIPPQPQASAAPPKKGGTVMLTINTTDTGEMKKIFGVTARHVRTKMTSQSSPDACNPSSIDIEQDGWYADISPAMSCRSDAVAHSFRGAVGGGGGSTAPSCQDKVAFKRTGAAAKGFPLQQTVTMNMGGGQSFSTTSEVIDFSTQPLDPALFDMPQGCKVVSSYQELMGMPAMGATPGATGGMPGTTNAVPGMTGGTQSRPGVTGTMMTVVPGMIMGGLPGMVMGGGPGMPGGVSGITPGFAGITPGMMPGEVTPSAVTSGTVTGGGYPAAVVAPGMPGTTVIAPMGTPNGEAMMMIPMSPSRANAAKSANPYPAGTAPAKIESVMPVLPKSAGAVRIGVVSIKDVTTLLPTTNLRLNLMSEITKRNLEAVPLDVEAPNEAVLAEAQQKQCDYVLFTTTQQVSDPGSKGIVVPATLRSVKLDPAKYQALLGVTLYKLGKALPEIKDAALAAAADQFVVNAVMADFELEADKVAEQVKQDSEVHHAPAAAAKKPAAKKKP